MGFQVVRFVIHDIWRVGEQRSGGDYHDHTQHSDKEIESENIIQGEEFGITGLKKIS